MYILGFETTGARGSVALCNLETREIREKSTEEPMGHLRNITELASQLLRERGVEPSELSGVAVSVGPGSYTGIRIGVSSALCQYLVGFKANYLLINFRMTVV